MRKLIILCIIGIAGIVGCKKPDQFSEIPSIDFKTIYTLKDVQGYDTACYVVINFTDGDGDIGYHSVESHLNDPEFDDPVSPYYNNYQVKSYRRENGVWGPDTIVANGQVFTIDNSSRMDYLSSDS